MYTSQDLLYRWSSLILAAPAAFTITHFAIAQSGPTALETLPANFSDPAAPPELLVAVPSMPIEQERVAAEVETPPVSAPAPTVPTVPFYSQFADISDPSWRKLGCGIASVAMLIDYHTDAEVSVDTLLARGIDNGAYLQNAGWTHAGLVNLARPYGLSGGSVGLHHLTPDAALAELTRALAVAPVMASVHYTFEPTNPIPHLVVITGIEGDTVFYNDPAEATGGGTISVEKFQRAWKQRYIELVPTSRS